MIKLYIICVQTVDFQKIHSQMSEYILASVTLLPSLYIATGMSVLYLNPATAQIYFTLIVHSSVQIRYSS